MKFIITGTAGFIGCNLLRLILEETEHSVVGVDALTYAGNRASFSDLENHPRHHFVKADICDAEAMHELFAQEQPDGVIHLAAESHVDRSIDGPGAFIQTNIIGTFNLLQAARALHTSYSGKKREDFRFLHVSTDEVYGSLSMDASGFTETTPYDPHSPYSASKAASDHLVRAWADTYGLPVLLSNCSNNYGPYQFPEKLIPVVILKCLRNEPIPVYGKGENVRDWLYVRDHARALLSVIERGRVGESYNIGGNNERTNIDWIRSICALLDELAPAERPHAEKISYVTDRPGHDLRYAIDASKIRDELGWEPQEDAASGLRKTVEWYLSNRDWWENILSGDYRLERLGNKI